MFLLLLLSMVVVCVVVLLSETRLSWQVRATRLAHRLHYFRVHYRHRLLPLRLFLLLRVVVVYHLCVCAVITKKHKVESPANSS